MAGRGDACGRKRMRTRIRGWAGRARGNHSTRRRNENTPRAERGSACEAVRARKDGRQQIAAELEEALHEYVLNVGRERGVSNCRPVQNDISIALFCVGGFGIFLTTKHPEYPNGYPN